MTIILSALAGLIVGGGAVHYWHKKHPIKINPRPNTGSGNQPGGH